MTVSVKQYIKGGLTPFRMRGGGYNGAGFSTYPITNGQAENIFKGDLVRVGSGTVSVCPTSATNVTGVFLGCTYNTQERGPVESNYFPTGAAVCAAYGRLEGDYLQPLAKVADHPNQTYVVFVPSSVASSYRPGDYCYVSVGAGSTLNGQASGHLIAAGSAGGATLQVVGEVIYPGREGTNETAIEVQLNPDRNTTAGL
jgi:hypothetical protein